MKRIIQTTILLISLLTFMSIMSCETENDDNDPTVYQKDKFIGNFNINDTLYNPTPNLYWYEDYILVINGDESDTSKIILTNFHNSGNDLTATVSGNVFVVSSQAYGTGGTTIHGNGSFENNILRYDMTTAGMGDYMEIYGEGPKL